MDRAKAVVFLTVGIGLLLTALALGARVNAFVAQSDIASGRVTGLVSGGSHPEITYTSRNGQIVSFSDSGFIYGYRPGDQVTVRYYPSAPRTSAKLDSLGALWFAPLMVGLIGLGLLIAGVLSLIAVRRS